ncbi:CAP domain-containing protein [Gemelliphila asaccharolytica]|uniref:SCP domain-containing protein n=1 Tax=Gemelliphila asaccharolytica TaxID=502393 RepID=A0ABR5TLI9_9BACL|nr:hypothetical protein [Gemella asaccharolytica]KXB56288.1 hypothetical protein HMPREF1871_01108 [Gemella asaccharolytica]
MKNVAKITSGLLAGVLCLTGFEGTNVVEAKTLPKVELEKSNENLTAKVVEINGKNYVEVTATKDVKNVKVTAIVGKDVLTFEKDLLKSGEKQEFELKLDSSSSKASETASEKVLPKTKAVTKEVTETLNAELKEKNVKLKVTYTLEKTVEVAEEAKSEVKKPEVKKETKPEVKQEETKEATKPAEQEAKTVAKEEKSQAKTTKEADVEVTKVATDRAANDDSTLVQPEAKPAAKQAAETLGKPQVVQPKQEEKLGRPEVQAPKSVLPQNAQSGEFNETIATEVFNQINDHRVANGLSPVTIQNASSYASSTETRCKEFYELIAVQKKEGMELHKRLDGRPFYTAFNNRVVGEILATSPQGASGLLHFWKTSQAHNEMMLNPKAKSVTVKVKVVNGWAYGIAIFS